MAAAAGGPLVSGVASMYLFFNMRSRPERLDAIKCLTGFLEVQLRFTIDFGDDLKNTNRTTCVLMANNTAQTVK